MAFVFSNAFGSLHAVLPHSPSLTSVCSSVSTCFYHADFDGRELLAKLAADIGAADALKTLSPLTSRNKFFMIR